MRAIKLLLCEEEFFGLVVSRGVSAVALGNEPVVLFGRAGHHLGHHLVLSTER